MKKTILLFALIFPCFSAFARSAQSSNQLGTKDPQNLFETIDENRQRHISFLRRLVESTKEGEERVQRVVAERFKELGCKVDVLRVVPTSLDLKNQFASSDVIDSTERVDRSLHHPRFR